MSRLYEKFTPAAKAHRDAAELISQWSFATDSMADLNPAMLAAMPYSLLAFDDQDHALLGHVGVKSYRSGTVEVGGQVTNPDRLREGIATGVLGQLIRTMPKHVGHIATCFAYVNPDSLTVYQAVGGVPDGMRPEPAPTGCDVVINLMPALEAAIPPEQYALMAAVGEMARTSHLHLLH